MAAPKVTGGNGRGMGRKKGRDAHGRFAVGNSGGPGAPQHDVKRLRESLLGAVTQEELHQTWRKLVDLVEAGDVEAIKHLQGRAFGFKTSAGLDIPPLPALAAKVRAAEGLEAFKEVVTEVIALRLEGVLSDEQARSVLDLIERKFKVVDEREIEERLKEIEAQLRTSEENNGW